MDEFDDLEGIEPNELLREQIQKIIKNQLKDNDPPETQETYDRLRKEGYDDFQTRQLIGQCIVVELFNIMKNEEMFDEERYISNLSNLPDPPYDDEDEEEDY